MFAALPLNFAQSIVAALDGANGPIPLFSAALKFPPVPLGTAQQLPQTVPTPLTPAPLLTTGAPMFLPAAIWAAVGTEMVPGIEAPMGISLSRPQGEKFAVYFECEEP